jgi:hypothetical protein
MTHHWDEFSKSLAEKSVPRRESLRLLGAALAGALLSPLGVRTAWAGGDPCKAFCNRFPRAQRTSCLAACQACSGDTSRLCGSGGALSCCATGTTCCSGICTSLANDFDNCGACGAPCDYPGPYEDGACVDGHCFYSCVPGAVDCGGTCTDLADDFDNCGACGAPCDYPGPYEDGACVDGRCLYWCVEGAVVCDGTCASLDWDSNNCGACGNICPESTPYCNQGVCVANDPNPDNCGGCPEGEVCYDGYCCDPGCTPDNPSYPNCGTVCGNPCLTLWTGLTWCGYGCVNLRSDPYNCGACGHQCGQAETCSGGTCQGICVGC